MPASCAPPMAETPHSALKPSPSKHPNRIVSKEDLMRADWGGVLVTQDSSFNA
jgi:hypothetical protein